MSRWWRFAILTLLLVALTPLNTQHATAEMQIAASDAQTVLATARSLLGIPYVHGGESRSGLDCSGFTMLSYASVGIHLPHYSGDQPRYGRRVSSPLPADLVWWPGHVAIYYGSGRVIGARYPGVRSTIYSIYGRPQFYRMVKGTYTPRVWKPARSAHVPRAWKPARPARFCQNLRPGRARFGYLWLGSRGGLVRRAQGRIGIRVNGRYDSRTRQAVIRLQTRQRLLVDGIIGRQTACQLNL